MEETNTRIVPNTMQLYAVLDDPQHEERDDVTQFVMESHDTLMDAIDFINETMAQELWQVSCVELVGIVPLNTCDDRTIKARKVLTSFPLERIFVPGHEDCLVVTPSHNLDDTTGSVHTEASTDYPASATGRINYLLGDAAAASMTTTDEDDDETDDEEFKPLPHHLRAASTSMVSMADTEAESTTPLTGFEGTGNGHNGDDEIADAAVSPLTSPEKADTGTTTTSKQANGEQPQEKETVSRALPNETLTSSTNSTTPLLDKVLGEHDEEGKQPSNSIVSGGGNNSLGLAYDVPIDSDYSAGDTTATPAAVTATNSTDITDGQDEAEKNESNADVAAGASVGAAAAGEVTAGVLAGQSDESSNKDQPPWVTADTTDKSQRAAPFPESSKWRNSVESSVASQKDTEEADNAKTSVRTGPHVAEMVSLFDKPPAEEPANDKAPVSDVIPDKAAARDSEEVHLLGGFTSEEDDDDNLFKPEIPQNLKTAGLRARGDSEVDGIQEQESVKTMEFPASDDDMTAAASFDNVVVVDLPDTSSETKGAETDVVEPSAKKDGVEPSAKKVEEKEPVVPAASDSERAIDTWEEEVTAAVNTGYAPVVPLATQNVTHNTQADNVAAEAETPEAMSKERSFPVAAAPVTTSKEDDNTLPTTTNGVLGKFSFDAAPAMAGFEEGFDSWKTDATLEDDDEGPNSFRPAADRGAIQPELPNRVPMTIPSLLGKSSALDWENNSDTEGEPLLLDRKPESDSAPVAVVTQENKTPEMSYKIGSTYFLLRERDSIEYPVKILSLGRRGTCIVEYEHHRAKKKVRTSSLLPDTKERRQKFSKQMKTGQVAKDLPDRISKEHKQRQTERHARHDERRRYGHQVSRDNLPTCSTEGTILEFKSRRVYFAKDKETVREIGKKFGVSSDRILFDNKIAYPTLKKTSRLRPLTSIVLPPA